MTYHSEEGLYFTRQPDGAVLVEKRTNDHAKTLVFSVRLPPGVWASVVTSMTKAGETFESYVAALEAQQP